MSKSYYGIPELNNNIDFGKNCLADELPYPIPIGKDGIIQFGTGCVPVIPRDGNCPYAEDVPVDIQNNPTLQYCVPHCPGGQDSECPKGWKCYDGIFPGEKKCAADPNLTSPPYSWSPRGTDFEESDLGVIMNDVFLGGPDRGCPPTPSDPQQCLKCMNKNFPDGLGNVSRNHVLHYCSNGFGRNGTIPGLS
tara:strand:+ start:860 stop:1435 length:576 start_codon:yes stop_codon:yes gene_type:complete